MITAEELHRRMGHIAPEAAKRLITEGSIGGIILDNTTVIKNCASCIHAKTHWKAIHKIHKEPRAAEFSDEIHSDLWGPSPVRTPGQTEYFASFTDDNTRWSSVDLLRMKDGTFQSFKNFEAWAIPPQYQWVQNLSYGLRGRIFGWRIYKILCLEGDQAENGTTQYSRV